jgi:hypothetical protein
MIWRDWSRAERLSLIGIIIAMLAAVAAWLVVPEIRNIFNDTKNKSASTSSTTLPIPATVAPAPNAAPVATIASSKSIVSLSGPGGDQALRSRIRLSHQVKKLEVTDNELTFAVAPRGVYGFGYGWDIRDITNLTLDRDETNSYYFEYHKLNDGAGELIGFVALDSASRLSREDRPSGFQLTVYNSRWSGAPILVSIPIDLITPDCKDRSIELDDGTHLDALDIKLK